MRHLLGGPRLCQLLSDDADERPENLLPLLDGKGPPNLLGSELAGQEPAARGGTMLFRFWCMAVLLAELSPGDPDTTRSNGVAPVSR